jgi:tRNA dimethylallyltransferase
MTADFQGQQARALHAAGPVLITGPTAVGKSAVALEMASRIGGEIISVDSMQVYRGLDIGTGKATLEERRRVPHHLIDIVGLNEAFDAARFVRLAREAVAEIEGRGRVPVLCGGTGLYFKAFLDGLGEAPAADAGLRAELESVPLTDLLQELQRSDPEAFARIDRNNRRRVVRAVEVIRLSGRPFSAQRSPWEKKRTRQERLRVFCMARSNADLRARIDARVDAMFANGLVEETRQLLARGLVENRTAMQAIGYRQVVEHLQGGRTLAETVALVKLRTRQYARRQRNWFRRQLDVDWIAVEPETGAEAVADRIRAQVGAGSFWGFKKT